MSEPALNGSIPDHAVDPMPESRDVAVDIDATLTSEPFRSVDVIPHATEEGRALLRSLSSKGLRVVLYTGRVFAEDPVIRMAQVARVERWIDEEGLRPLVARVWPWPKPYARAFVDDRAVTWRGHHEGIAFECESADQHARRKRRVLLVSPLSDRYNGIGNFGAPALGVWRLRAACLAAGHECDIWDCNTERDVPARDKVNDLVREFYALLRAKFDPASYDWIGFSILNDTLPLTLGLANLVRKEHPFPKQVAGNAEATLNYQDILDKSTIDCVLVGEADYALPRLVSGDVPTRVDGCVWFHRATRMSSEKFNAAYEPLDWGEIPWNTYGLRTAELYHGPGCPRGKESSDACECGTYRPYVQRWMDEQVFDESLVPHGVSRDDALGKLYSCMTVRLVTMDHCFLPCTYCLDGRTLIRTEHGLQEIQSIVQRGERIRVMQHDGTLGLATEFHRRLYSGPLVRLDVSGHSTPLFLTPDHAVRVDDGRSVPAKDLRPGDCVLAVARPFAAGAETTTERATVREVGEARLDNGEVFNIGVEPLHTYVANGIAVDNCSTARIPDFATGKFQRSVFLGMDAIKHLYLKIKREVKGVLTIYDDSDETFLGTKRGLEYAAALMEIKAEMDAGTPRGFRYLVQTRSNEMTRELVQKLAAAGVQHLTFGVENASAYVRDSLRKRQDDQQLLDLIDWCVESSVTCYYLLILFPPETRVEDLEINVRVIREWIRRGAVVSAEPYLMPYRGTPILDDPHYTYEHVAFDVPFSGTPAKRLKWPTLIWPRDPAVRGILIAYRATLDDAIKRAREAAGHQHSFKGFTGKICVEHLARVLEMYYAGVVKSWGGEATDDAAKIGAVYQEYFGQESGVTLRDRTQREIELSMQGTRFNPSTQKFTVAAGVNGTNGDAVSELKQGVLKTRAQKDPAAPGEVILDGK